MDPKDKIIVALDFDTLEKADKFASKVAPYVGGFKVGLELMNNCGAPQLVSKLNRHGTKIFFDGKFNDIPNTVTAASRAATRLGVWMFNVHATGGKAMMAAALDAATSASKTSGINRPLVIAVTILTSFDADGLRDVGFEVKDEKDIEDHVVRLALLAKSAGLDGVVASPKEITAIRAACGSDFKIITPGIRPGWAAKGDQKRITTPKEAVKMGSDYLVIGRPITNPPENIGSPVEAAKKIADEISGG